jgi:hypothetical protein
VEGKLKRRLPIDDGLLDSIDALDLFVVYDHPRDFPEKFVVRRWQGIVPTAEFALADSLEEARAKVPGDCVRIDRNPADDPAILETWL